MQIAVDEVGNIGSTFAFQLARHHDVTVVARPGSPRFHQLHRDQGIVNTLGERAEESVADTLVEEVTYDLVIVTLLIHQVDAVLPALQRSAANCIQFMFNNFEPEHLQDAVGADRCSFGMSFVQALIGEYGRLKATIGAGGQKTLMGQQRWVDVSNAAGLPSVLEPDMLLWLCCHAPMCVAFESVTVAGVRRGGCASWDESMVLARGVKEAFSLIQGLGFRVYPKGKARINISPAWVLAAILWFISRIRSFRELLPTGTHECRAVVDVMVAEAPRSNPPIQVAKIQAMKPAKEFPAT